MTAEETLPPHDEHAERVALGLMLQLGGETVREVLEVCEPAQLYRPAHQTVFAAIARLHQAGEPVAPETVSDELRRAGELERIGGGAGLATLIEAPALGSSAVRAAELVAERAGERRLIESAMRALQVARDPAGSLEEKSARVASVLAEAQPSAAGRRVRMVAGDEFIHGIAEDVPALWGSGDDVLWAEGEPLLLTGPTGVGKTTVSGQLLAARLGLLDAVLGFPVTPGKRALYLAMDRPSQIARAHNRLLRQFPREVLAERLVVWKGPPPEDLARNPESLLRLADQAGADTVFIDSLKDAAKKLTEEETGQGLNEAMQLAVSAGVEVVALHHQRKQGTGTAGGKPTSISDVYGSNWITAGCGSILLLWGAAGDLVVELSHLKQPAGVVGPLRLVHDPAAGTTAVRHQADVLDVLDHTPRAVRELAMAMRADDQPATEPEVERVRRRLERLVREGVAAKLTGERGKSGAYVRRGPLDDPGAGVTPLFEHDEPAAS